MKGCFSLLVLVVLSNCLYAQSFLRDFTKGYIITNNDTLECFVSLQGTYNHEVEYKLAKDSVTLTASVDTVNFIVTDFNCYGKICVKGKCFIPRILCWGRINLYEQIEFGQREMLHGSSYKSVARYNETTTCFIEKGDTILNVPHRKIGEKISFLFDDDEAVFNVIVKKNRLSNDELIKIIDEYNKGKL